MLACVSGMLNVWEMAQFAAGVSQELIRVHPCHVMLYHHFSQSCNIAGFCFFAVGFCLPALPLLRGDNKRTQGMLLNLLSSDCCTRDLYNSSICSWKGGQGRLCIPLDSQTYSFSLTPLVYSCVPSVKWDATSVILALHGGLHSSPT